MAKMDADELKRAVAAYGRAPEANRPALRRVLLRRAGQLGRMDLIPDEWTARKLAEDKAGSRGGKIVTRKLTRGPKKGQTVRGYLSPGGQFSEIKTNTGKGPRAGKEFITTRDSKGRRVHTYADGTSVTLRKSKKGKPTPGGRATRVGYGRSGRKPGTKPATRKPIVHGSVSEKKWAELRRKGWKGRAGDRQEALYPPRSAR